MMVQSTAKYGFATSTPKPKGVGNMNMASTIIPLIAIFLLASFVGTLFQVQPLDIAFTVAGFYGLGSIGLLLMYRTYRHVENPNMKKAYVGLLLGLMLILVSYWMLEFMLWETRMF